MGKLKEFLSQEVEKLRAEANSEAEENRRWSSSAYRLFDQIETWIRDADPNKVVEIDRSVTMSLDRITPIPILWLKVGLRRVSISASSRRVAGIFQLPDDPVAYKPAGLVVVEGGDHTYRLYLFRTGGEDRWYLQTHGMNLQSLDRELFESLITTTLQ